MIRVRAIVCVHPSSKADFSRPHIELSVGLKSDLLDEDKALKADS